MNSTTYPCRCSRRTATATDRAWMHGHTCSTTCDHPRCRGVCWSESDCWRARYLALRDAVRDEREAEATYRTASRFIGGEEADARHDEHQQARAAVDRILDGAA